MTNSTPSSSPAKRAALLEEFKELAAKDRPKARPRRAQPDGEIVARDLEAGTIVRKVYVDGKATSSRHRGIDLLDAPERPVIRALDDPRDLAEATQYLARLDELIATEPKAIAALKDAHHSAAVALGSINKHHPEYETIRGHHDGEICRLQLAADRIDDAKGLRLRVWGKFPQLDPRPKVERLTPAPARRAFRFIRKMVV